jgi:hypothetical protein
VTALLRTCRVLLALLGFSALVTEVAVLVERGQFVAGNFFSFFTVEANGFAIAVLLATAVATGPFRRLDLFRGASTLFMLTTIVVFTVLLSDLDPQLLTAVPWDNTVLHYLVPLGVMIDWLVDPPRARIPLRSTVAWLVVPLAYVVYSLVRGPIVGWYPYPFLDPDHGGYPRVVGVSLVIAVALTFFAWLVTRVRPRGVHDVDP